MRATVERTMGLSPRELKMRLVRRARRAGLTLAADLLSSLVAYLDLLARWNQRINLTSLPLTEPSDETFDRLLIEPLVAARHLPSPTCHVIDLGSGGGSPAIPLKLAEPGISLRMVESKTRKTAFLSEAVRQLGLDRASVETARFEELLARPALHEAHDIATVRAVRVNARVLMTAQAFLKPGGSVFLFRASGNGALTPSEIPGLVAEATHVLVESLGSRLVILKRPAFR